MLGSLSDSPTLQANRLRVTLLHCGALDDFFYRKPMRVTKHDIYANSFAEFASALERIGTANGLTCFKNKDAQNRSRNFVVLQSKIQGSWYPGNEWMWEGIRDAGAAVVCADLCTIHMPTAPKGQSSSWGYS
jgi:hypothetical protein